MQCAKTFIPMCGKRGVRRHGVTSHTLRCGFVMICPYPAWRSVRMYHPKYRKRLLLIHKFVIIIFISYFCTNMSAT